MVNKIVKTFIESATLFEKERVKQIPINITKISNLPTFVIPMRGLSHSSKSRNAHACMKNLVISHCFLSVMLSFAHLKNTFVYWFP